MDLPWILLFISILLIAVIAWHSSRFSLTDFVKKILPRKKTEHLTTPYHEAIQDDLFSEDEYLEEELFPVPAQPEVTSPSKNLILAINLKAPEGKSFGGEQLVVHLNRLGLRFGSYDIFHFEDQFSLASAYEPGTFDLNRLESLKTSALIFFMETAHLKDVREAFETMLETAQILARQLRAELFDEQWKPLTPETIERYYDRIDEVA